METGQLTKTDIIQSLKQSIRELEELVLTCDVDSFKQAMGESKWSIQQIIGHLYDTEEVWSKRIEQVILRDDTVFQSYDPEMYVKERAYELYTMEELKALINRFKERRSDTLQLLEQGIWDQSGMHPEEGIMTVQMLAETIALHEQHHLSQIKTILSKNATST
ncbi:DinB family protein [Bacillus sp. 179-C3.3 HS]|uniref:DinB family protein n=1 Tax=Bacillus sp. 179-C3.3 HS TaxID=3232162 RepID=UPI00399FC293